MKLSLVLAVQIVVGVVGVIWYDDLTKLSTHLLNAWFIFVLMTPVVFVSALESQGRFKLDKRVKRTTQSDV